MLNRFIQYLDALDIKLQKMFSHQATFIKCKIGCSKCCENGNYPMSELEYANLLDYYNLLSGKLKNVIDENIKNLLETNKGENYVCPFLIKGICSVYTARPLICRTFGLLSYNKEKEKNIPFCVDLGLNYAEVYDNKTSKSISKGADGTAPIAFNIDRQYLRSSEFEKEFNICFGEDKKMIDWLREDFSK